MASRFSIALRDWATIPLPMASPASIGTWPDTNSQPSAPAARAKGSRCPPLPVPHLREADGAAAAARPVVQVRLAFADLGERASEVAVPLDRVHREVEMRVEDQRRTRGFIGAPLFSLIVGVLTRRRVPPY